MRVLLLASVVTTVDQITKVLAVKLASWHPTVLQAGPFELAPTINTGAAGGISPGAATFLLPVSIVVVAVLFVASSRSGAKPAMGHGLVLGGAAGNFLDRAIHGHVVDFLGVNLPLMAVILNVADVALVVGLAEIVLGSRAQSALDPCCPGSSNRAGTFAAPQRVR